MSKPMTMVELPSLLNHIKKHHSFCNNTHGRHVKYIDPHIDTRTWTCFAITFRTGGEEVLFHTQNECRNLPTSLHDRIIDWLSDKGTEAC